MPLRVVEFEGLSYAFIILADPKWGDEDCHVMMISGTFSHFSLAQLIMHFAQNQPFTAELGTDGSIWGWTGPKAKLNTLLGYDLYCSCANCWIKCAACMDQQCSKCRYFRYCSRACSIQGWKPRLLGPQGLLSTDVKHVQPLCPTHVSFQHGCVWVYVELRVQLVDALAHRPRTLTCACALLSPRMRLTRVRLEFAYR